MTNERGRIIGGRYEVLRPLAKGGQASVSLAVDHLLEEQVVIKEIAGARLEPLRCEFGMLCRLRHPNLAEVRELIEIDGRSCLVLAFAPGPDLGAWAADATGPELLLAVAAVARALQFIHDRGVMHRDLKPGHIRVGEGSIGSLPAARVLDFGLATAAPAADVAGTLGYIAPEVLAGDAATPAADLFSLGVVLHECLLGELPAIAVGRPARDRAWPADRVEPALGQLLEGLLDLHPEQRPSAKAVLETIGRIIGRSVQVGIEELAGPFLPPLPLVGRGQALARLDGAIEATRGGEHAVLSVSGCGKSALLQEACLRAQAAGLQLHPATSPAALAAGASGEPRAAASQILDGLLDRARTKATLVALDDCPPGDPVVGALRDQLQTLGPEASAGLLLLLCDEGDADITLGCLSAEETGHIVRAMLYPLRFLPDWADEVHAITGGDPRVLAHLLCSQIEAGLPRTLQHSTERERIVHRRLAALGAAEQRVLGVLAQSTRPVSRRVLQHVAGAEAAAVLPNLLTRGLLTLEPRGIVTAGRLVREAAVELLPKELLRDVHERFAAALRAEPVADNAALAHHLLHGGRIDAAVELLLDSAAPAPEDLEVALDALPETAARRPAVMRRRATMLRARGEGEEALELADRLARSSPDDGALLRAELLLDAGEPQRALQALDGCQTDSAEVRLLAGRAQFLLGDTRRAAEEAAAGRQAEGLTPDLEAQLDHIEGLALVYSGANDAGLELLARAEQQARTLGARSTLARVLNSRGIALQRLGDQDAAAVAFRECLELFQQLGELGFAASCMLNLGTIAHLGLELGEALEHYRDAAEVARRVGSVTLSASAASNESNLLLLFGAYSEAESSLQQAEAAAQAAGAGAELGYVQLYEAELRLAQAEPRAARTALDRARRCFRSADSAGLALADILALEVDLATEGELATARRAVEELASRVPWSSPDRWRLHLLAARVELAARPPALAEAARQLELAAALANARGAAPMAWEVLALQAHCTEELGRPPEASYHRRRFAEELEALRRRIPIPYRGAFDCRADVQRAIERAGAGADASSPGATPTQFRRLLAINREIGRQLPLELLLTRILECALELTGAERGFVLLSDAGEGLHLEASRNLDGEPLRHGIRKLSRSIAMRAIAEDRPVITSDAMEDPRFGERVSISGLRLRAVLCVPLRRGDRPCGALYVDNRFRPGAFRKDHVELMETFADQAAIAIEGARLLQQTEEQRVALATAMAELEQLNEALESQVARQSEELSAISSRLRAQEQELVQRYNAARIIGRSRAMCELFVKIDRVAEADVPVFIFGESGSGKELVARAIHQGSSRAELPFVSVNCGAIPGPLLESELFGHVRGAFTGATRDRPGLFEVAGRGTLLLDEVGDMPAEMQVKLLRILQEGTFRRVGDERERRSACRVLSASHRDLDQLVARGRLREDLYYRLQVIRLDVPPLRERREDIPLLVEHILDRLGKPVRVSSDGLAALVDHGWPGNVRQLENELQRASLLCDGEILPRHLSLPVPSKRVRLRTTTLQQELKRYERQLVREVLQETGHNVSEAAQRLGMHRVALHRKLRALGLMRPPRE